MLDIPNWFNKEISLGNLVSLIIMLFTFYKFHIQNVKRIEKFAHRTALLWADFCKRHGLQIEEEDSK